VKLLTAKHKSLAEGIASTNSHVVHALYAANGIPDNLGFGSLHLVYHAEWRTYGFRQMGNGEAEFLQEEQGWPLGAVCVPFGGFSLSQILW
jgi:hypothetical protein